AFDDRDALTGASPETKKRAFRLRHARGGKESADGFGHMRRVVAARGKLHRDPLFGSGDLEAHRIAAGAQREQEGARRLVIDAGPFRQCDREFYEVVVFSDEDRIGFREELLWQRGRRHLLLARGERVHETAEHRIAPAVIFWGAGGNDEVTEERPEGR